MELGGDKLSNFRLGKFMGKIEKWPPFRDGFEAFLWAVNLGDVLITPRPVPAIPAPVVGAGGVAAPGGGAGGGGGDPDPEEDDGDDRDGAGGGGPGPGAVVAPAVPPAVPAGPDPGELWDLKNAKVFYYLLVYTEGAPQSVVSQFRSTRDGAAAFGALKEKYNPQGSFGKSILHKQFASFRLEPPTRDPDDYFLELDRCNANLSELDSAYPEDPIVGIVVSKLTRSVYGSIIGIWQITLVRVMVLLRRLFLGIPRRKDLVGLRGRQRSGATVVTSLAILKASASMRRRIRNPSMLIPRSRRIARVRALTPSSRRRTVLAVIKRRAMV